MRSFVRAPNRICFARRAFSLRRGGIEPPASPLSAECSAAELPALSYPPIDELVDPLDGVAAPFYRNFVTHFATVSYSKPPWTRTTNPLLVRQTL